MKVFYDSLIQIEYLHSQIEQLPVSHEDKIEIIHLVEDTLHHHIIHRILIHIHEDNHPIFLDKLTRKPHDRKIIDFLKEHAAEIEDHIKEAAEEIKYDLLKLIRETTST